MPARRTFPDECCFQVIYFNSNISFADPIETGLTAGVETTRLTRAVKNAWVRRANQHFPEVCADI
jgi:hypothetical protein